MKRLIVAVLLIMTSHFTAAAEGPQRIVSMSPAITEVLCELGLLDNIVGVTDYCKFPEGVKRKTRIGCYLNPDYEAIYLLRPDIVIAPVDYGEGLKTMLDKAGIKYIMVDMFTIDAVLNAIEEIGRATGREEKAAELRGRLKREADALKEKAGKKQQRRVMIVVGRNAGSFDDLYIAAKGTFYDQLLNVLGCKNAYTKKGIRYPTISAETVLRLDPDVIIEVLPGSPEKDKPKIISEWGVLKEVSAVKNGKVYVLNGDYVAIPGPRFILTLKDIEEML